MYDDDIPRETIGRALPDAEPPPRFDLDKVVSDGYRARRRNRAALGGAATAGVVAVAAAIALVINLGPGRGPDHVAADPGASSSAPGREPTGAAVEDRAMAGYPYSDSWDHGLDPETNAYVDTEEAEQVNDTATGLFGPLLVEAGLWDEPRNLVDTLGCDYFEDSDEECEYEAVGVGVSGHHRPGNYGQVWLRTLLGTQSVEYDGRLRDVFSLEVMLPGGWTAEPGPITEQLFPQHLISDGPYYTADAPAFDSDELDDGRTVMIADHGCAYDLAVVYPNGTALRVSWDVDCSGDRYEVDFDALLDAALAMPEFDFDTGALRPVDDLWDVPTGWVDPAEEWADSPEIESMAARTYDDARAALLELYPDADLGTGEPRILGVAGRGLTVHHSYGGSGTLPFEWNNLADGVTEPLSFDLRYYLPGGWMPGASGIVDRGPYLKHCDEDAECDVWEDDDGTVWLFEEQTRDVYPEEGAEPLVDHSHQFDVVRCSPDGWAVGIWLSWDGDLPVDADMLGELLRAMPAPTYDEENTPRIPAG